MNNKKKLCEILSRECKCKRTIDLSKDNSHIDLADPRFENIIYLGEGIKPEKLKHHD